MVSAPACQAERLGFVSQFVQIEFGDILPKPTTVGTGLATTLGAGEFPLLIPDGMVLGVFQWAVNSHVVLIDSASDKRNPRF